MLNNPVSVGIGLRAPHYTEILNTHPPIAWLEIHSENYFSKGGKPYDYLTQIGRHYPISLHGVGLSLGSSDQLNMAHLAKIKSLIQQFSPLLVSEHLSWSSIEAQHFHHLLPLPYTEESLTLLTHKINEVQAYLDRQLLIENIASTLEFTHSVIPEAEFMNALSTRTGCGILLDVNNLYINSINHGWNAEKYLEAIIPASVKEIHLAGASENHCETAGILLIDSHDSPVSPAVWALYEQALYRFGQKPTLIEWDSDIPVLDVLLAQANIANQYLDFSHAIA